MKKHIITATTFVACLTLWAAVWPQSEPAGETSATSIPHTVIATQPEVPEAAEIEELITPEEERGTVP